MVKTPSTRERSRTSGQKELPMPSTRWGASKGQPAEKGAGGFHHPAGHRGVPLPEVARHAGEGAPRARAQGEPVHAALHLLPDLSARWSRSGLAGWRGSRTAGGGRRPSVSSVIRSATATAPRILVFPVVTTSSAPRPRTTAIFSGAYPSGMTMIDAVPALNSRERHTDSRVARGGLHDGAAGRDARRRARPSGSWPDRCGPSPSRRG